MSTNRLSNTHITDDYLDLVRLVSTSISIPPVSGIHLPELTESTQKSDEFGFVFLQDGSAGPFYTSLDNTLAELWQRYPYGINNTIDTVAMIESLSADSPALRAVAWGAFNALSQHIMSRAGYLPTQNNSTSSVGICQPKKGEKVCMVGCFTPLIKQLREKRVEVLVLEKNPGRVELQHGVSVSTNPADIMSCEHILCTAATLINGSIATILNHSDKAKTFSLIGPSGSGLPDVLFKHGVGAVGGIQFYDNDALKAALEKQESWGRVGNKYQIICKDYPGIAVLLQSIGA